MTKLYDAMAEAAVMEMKGEQHNSRLTISVSEGMKKAAYKQQDTLKEFDKTMDKGLNATKIAGWVGMFAAGLGSAMTAFASMRPLVGGIGGAIGQAGGAAPDVAAGVAKGEKEKVSAELQTQQAAQDLGESLGEKASKAEGSGQQTKNELLAALSKAISTRASASQRG